MSADFPVSVNEGLAVFLLCALGFAAWKFGWAMFKKVFGDGKDDPGLAGIVMALGERYVVSNETTNETLQVTQREQVVINRIQAETCNAHVAGLGATAHGVQQLKAVALANCEMCRQVSERLATQFPSIAEVVLPHCDAIKKKLEETA